MRAELHTLLVRRNGFYALGQALHVLPSLPSSAPLDPWNDPRTWSGSYGNMARGCDFFAHDLFGNPFAFQAENIVLFDAETGETESVASTLEGWAGAVMNEDYWTGASLARGWQAEHGSLQVGRRLLPKQLFVLGGDYALENLYVGDVVESLNFRATVAHQIRDLPDGAEIHFVLAQQEEPHG